MLRNAALGKPTFWYTTNPALDELMQLNKQYSKLIEDAGKHQMNQNLFEAKWDRLQCYHGQNNGMLEREQASLQEVKSKLQTDDFLLQGKIENLVRKIYSDFQDMVTEMSYDDSELSEQKFAEFLLGYKKVIEGGNNLPYFKKTNHFQDIVEAIGEHCPEINKN